jgi:hypothetical protein
MALRCGHRGTLSQEERARLVTEGRCPICPDLVEEEGREEAIGYRKLEQHTDWVRPYGQCPCCLERWIVEDGQARMVIFT